MRALHAWLLLGITITVVQIKMENRGNKGLGDHGLGRAHKDSDSGASAQGDCTGWLGWEGGGGGSGGDV